MSVVDTSNASGNEDGDSRYELQALTSTISYFLSTRTLLRGSLLESI
jgi:hypothetical protein